MCTTMSSVVLIINLLFLCLSSVCHCVPSPEPWSSEVRAKPGPHTGANHGLPYHTGQLLIPAHPQISWCAGKGSSLGSMKVVLLGVGGTRLPVYPDVGQCTFPQRDPWLWNVCQTGACWASRFRSCSSKAASRGGTEHSVHRLQLLLVRNESGSHS